MRKKRSSLARSDRSLSRLPLALGFVNGNEVQAVGADLEWVVWNAINNGRLAVRQTPTEGATMNPATPKTEPPPSTPFRKAVFGGSLTAKRNLLLVAAFAAILMLAAASGQEQPKPPFATAKPAPKVAAGRPAAQSADVRQATAVVIQRLVAIDNVCAWPNLTVLRDGTIIAMIFNRPNHGLEAGDIDCWASTDGGRTWKKRGTPGPHEPETNRIHVAAGLAGNGDLIAITGGWSNRYPSESTPAFANSKSPDGSRLPFRFELVPTWVARSSDGGFTWSIDKRSFPALGPNGVACTPFGNIQTAADGSLCVAVYNRPMPALRAFVYRSRDDGKTWGEPVALDEKVSRNETALLHLGDGQWLAAARSYGPHGIYLYRSTDDARSWQQSAPLTATAQYPAHLLKLRDGRLLLSYGNRVASQFGVVAMTSADNGVTWSNPITVVRDLTSGDCGYPASVQLPGGEILTAYYAGGVVSHQRYHMGTVIWKPPAK